jgi:hypothetical protein
MKIKSGTLIISILGLLFSLVLIVPFAGDGFSYPPAVGISGSSKNCLTCHIDNGPWKDDEMAVVDILDKGTGKSLRQPDGFFLVEARKGEPKTIVTVLGRKANDTADPPTRNAWIYIDQASPSITKFPQGWQANLQYSCRVVGDTMSGFEGMQVTIAPMTILAGDSAQDAEVNLQAMVTTGTAVKAKAKEGLVGNFLERKLKLKVVQ